MDFWLFEPTVHLLISGLTLHSKVLQSNYYMFMNSDWTIVPSYEKLLSKRCSLVDLRDK